MQTTEQNKLEIKHLASYFPYGLKFTGGYTLESISMDGEMMLISEHRGFINHRDGWNNITPILRPLSDLTKQIEHKGETFVPVEQIKWCMPNTPGWDNVKEFTYHDLSKTIIEHCVFDKVTEWMFDVYGLINQGLAIDVNTLPENPYK